jgi:2-methylisocitrate lyase-like PEP mutase family enzyme
MQTHTATHSHTRNETKPPPLPKKKGRYIHEATRTIPIIGDGDTGYGNALNVKRTVKGYAAAGFAGILIEDQVWPKSCGHVRGKRVVPRDEAVARIKAAADARDEGADILIVARTDARQAVSLDEALARAQAFAEAGADVLFIDALASVEEMRAFCGLGGAAARVPKMANMLEGGGKTPILPPAELQAMGFALVAYPMSLLGVSIRAMQTALEGLKDGRVPPPAAMGTFGDILAAVGFPEYFAEEARYAVASGSGGASTGGGSASAVTDLPPTVTGTVTGATSAAAAAASAPAAAAEAEAAEATVVVEPDAVIAGALVPSSPPSSSNQQQQQDADAAGEWAQLRRSKFLRVRVSDARTGLSKLETRIPASFVGSLAAMVPQVAGVDLDEMLRSAVGGRLDLDAPLVDYQTPGGDVIKVWLEQ